MEKIEIYRYQAEQIANTLRMVANRLDSKPKKTSLDRDIMQSIGMMQNVLSNEFDIIVKRF